MGGQDIAELHRRGRGHEVLQAADRAAASLSGYQSFSARITGEWEERIEEGKLLLTFGVEFLDIMLGGIALHDLILIGAKTNRGKTELVTIAATMNAARGKRVHYIALEAEHREIERRTKYKLVSKLVSERVTCPISRERMNYLDWRYGRLQDVTGPFESQAQVALMRQMGTLYTLYRRGHFGPKQLQERILEVRDVTDLVIVDHLHYVDSDDANENRAYKDIVKTIRDSALEIGKPVIVVAHVRKSDRRAEPLIPGIEDFFGTSDIPKIATKAIMIAPADDRPSRAPHIFNTYMRISKCRPDGARLRYVGVVPYNAQLGIYEDSFELGRLTNNEQEFEEIKESPRWARRIQPGITAHQVGR
jgi:hypothetical protein